MSTTRPVATSSSYRVVQNLDLDEGHQFDLLHEELSYPVPTDQFDALAGVEVDQAHFDLASVSGVDSSRCIHDRESGFRRQTRARMNQAHHSEWKSNCNSGSHHQALTGCEGCIGRDVQIYPCVTFVGSLRDREAWVESFQRDSRWIDFADVG